MNISSNSKILKGFLLDKEDEILKSIKTILRANYWRDIYTPSGKKMSIKITNCGDFGWYTDNKGYRYTKVDPKTNKPWVNMPEILKELAIEAAEITGYMNFDPNCCLLNRYEVGSKLSLHQDTDEKDFTQPIVSFSFGLPANFLFGGSNRKDNIDKYLLENGDVLVFGGQDRMRFHGVEEVKNVPILSKVGDIRINLTFRKAD